jgi:hypothetical protein
LTVFTVLPRSLPQAIVGKEEIPYLPPSTSLQETANMVKELGRVEEVVLLLLREELGELKICVNKAHLIA